MFANATSGTVSTIYTGDANLLYVPSAGALTASQFLVPTAILTSTSKGALSVGTLSYSDTGHLATLQASKAGYIQTEIQNTSSGTTASADHVVANDITTASTYYGDFGINSSGFTGSGSFNTPNMVYLTATTGDLAIGTTTSNVIHFVVNGGATDAAKITTAGTLISTNAPNIGTTTSGATITPTTAYGQYQVTALAVTASIAIPTGTVIDGQKLIIRIKDNGTAQAISWVTSAGGYRAQGVVLPITTVISTPLYVGCIYNGQDSFWDVVAVS